MISALLVIPLIAIFFGFMTLGTVLLVKFFLTRLARPTRVLVASILAPLSVMIPASLISLAEGDADIADVLIALIIGGGFFSVIFCWPIAHFATKRLDQLTEFDIETFT